PRIRVRVIQLFFFFSSRRRHTRFSRDWSSDVCSSDLLVGLITRRSSVQIRLPQPLSKRPLSGVAFFVSAFSQAERQASLPFPSVSLAGHCLSLFWHQNSYA